MHLIVKPQDVVLVTAFALFGRHVDFVGNPINDIARFGRTAQSA